MGTAGQASSGTRRIGRKTQYAYDNLHRRVEENWLDGSEAVIRTFAHSYDALGRLTGLDETIGSASGTNYEYAYDGLGRVTSETQSLVGLSSDITFVATYDAGSRRTQLLATLGTYDDFDNRYYYDNLSRLTSIDQRQRTSGTSTVIAPKRFDFAYNAAGQLAQLTRFADLSGFEFVANQFNQYDGLGRLTRLLHTTDATAPTSGWGTGALAGYDYAYDAATRLTEIDSFADGLTEYSHDDTNQLTAADHTGQTDESYTYDANGNRTGGGYSTGANNQTTEDGVYTYTYDDEGNRLTRTRVADGYVTAYEWDHRNRLVSVTELDDAETVLSETTHDYDAFNQWIRRTVDADGPGENDAVETLFAHHDGQIVYQFAGDEPTDLTNRYLWNPSTIDQLLVDEMVADLSTAGDLQFPLGDHLGTVRDIAEYDSSTDTTSVSNHIRYSSFGSVESETNSSIDLLFGFTSRPFEESTGLQNNLHRWYDAALGQWASEDPIGFAAGDANVRRYVGNLSLSAIDPDGRAIVFASEAEARKFIDTHRTVEWHSVVASDGRVFVFTTPSESTLHAISQIADALFPDLEDDAQRTMRNNFIMGSGAVMGTEMRTYDSSGRSAKGPATTERDRIAAMYEQLRRQQKYCQKLNFGGEFMAREPNGSHWQFNIEHIRFDDRRIPQLILNTTPGDWPFRDKSFCEVFSRASPIHDEADEAVRIVAPGGRIVVVNEANQARQQSQSILRALARAGRKHESPVERDMTPKGKSGFGAPKMLMITITVR